MMGLFWFVGDGDGDGDDDGGCCGCSEVGGGLVVSIDQGTGVKSLTIPHTSDM